MDPKIRALRLGKAFTGSQEVYHNYDYLLDKRNSKHCREYLPTPSLYMISICFRYRKNCGGGRGPNPQLHQPRLPAGKSNSRSKLESLTRYPNSKVQLESPTRKPTRKSNSKVQLEIPTRNPNSAPSLSPQMGNTFCLISLSGLKWGIHFAPIQNMGDQISPLPPGYILAFRPNRKTNVKQKVASLYFY